MLFSNQDLEEFCRMIIKRELALEFEVKKLEELRELVLGMRDSGNTLKDELEAQEKMKGEGE